MSKAGIVEELHRGARRNFPRRYVTIKGPNDLYQMDLVEMIPYAGQNRGYKYLLTMIDTFSKRAWAVPLKQKNMEETSKALDNIFKGLKNPPKLLQADAGTEFFNRMVKAVLAKYGIKLYSSYSTLKASIIERFNRTLKTWMWKKFSLRGTYKWVDLLDSLLETYNNRVHRTIGVAPAKVSESNEKMIHERLLASNRKMVSKVRQRKKPKFKVGDKVRISKFKHEFEKGYTPNWTAEVFTVDGVQRTLPVTYRLKGWRGDEIKGGFYEQELQKTRYENTFLVEKVLRRKGNKAYVKWLGFDKTYNEWIDAKDFD